MLVNQSQVGVEADCVAVEELKQPESNTKPKPKNNPKSKCQPPYAVVLHNDDINGMWHVVDSLRKVFHYNLAKATRLMMHAHLDGCSVVWSGSLEVAELKAEQLKSCGPDPGKKCQGALSLRITVEPLPN